MYKEYKPNEAIIDRAVELWIKALRNPEYRAHAEHDNSIEAHRMSAMTAFAATHQNKNNQDEEVLSKFGEALKSLLMNKQPLTHNPEVKRYITNLDVDYDPCSTLRSAAEKAGLKVMFPIKTSMYLSADSLSFSLGYGTKTDNHYPLTGDRKGWLVTDLRGSDIEKIIQVVNAGHDIGLEVEYSDQLESQE